MDEAGLRRLFNSIDTNGDGVIDLPELEAAAKVLQLPLGTAAASLMAEADTNHDGLIDYGEFTAIMRKREQLMAKLFARLDLDHDGALDAAELRQALGQALHLEFTEDEALRMFQKIDGRNAGRVSFADFETALYLFPAHTQRELVQLWRTSAALPFLLYSDHPRRQSAQLTLAAGFLAGAVSRSLTAPFDRLSLVLRAGGTVHAGKGIGGALQSMVRAGGVRSLWRGNGVNCAQVGPESALTFFFYEALKRALLLDPDRPPAAHKFALGALAGAAAMTLVYPMYVLQARMAVAEPGVYRGAFDCLRRTVALEGAGSLFKGYVPSLVRIGPYKAGSLNGSDIVVFGTLKELLVPPGDSPTFLQSMTFGGAASAFSQSLTYPLVTARTKLQAQGAAQGRPEVYRGMLDALQKTVRGDAKLGLRAEGWRGLYNGCGANLLKMVPAVALQFTVYERALRLLEPYL